MPNRLKIRFSGLCGLVPKFDLDERRNRVRVLLVDAMGHGGSGTGEHHEPVLLLPCVHTVRDSGYRRGWGPACVSHTPMIVFPLARQDLFFGDPEDEYDAEPELEISCQAITKSCPRADGTDGSSLCWVASMPEVYATGGAVTPDYLNKAGSLDLAARVLLTRGTLETAGFARDWDPNGVPDRIIQWGFGNDAGAVSSGGHRALAEVVLYTLETEESTLELTCRHAEIGGDQKIGIQFPQEGEVEGYVLNMPWPDILRQRRGRGYIDLHFKHFYDLSERNVYPHNRMYPQLRRLCDGSLPDAAADLLNVDGPPPSAAPGEERADCDIVCTLSVSNPQCPPALFEPDSSV